MSGAEICLGTFLYILAATERAALYNQHIAQWPLTAPYRCQDVSAKSRNLMGFLALRVIQYVIHYRC
jgi:hypothetical protein